MIRLAVGPTLCRSHCLPVHKHAPPPPPNAGRQIVGLGDQHPRRNQERKQNSWRS